MASLTDGRCSINVFRVLATEFSSIDDETVNIWLDLTAPLVSRKQFGKMYDQALALLTAHRMKTTGVGTADAGGDSLGDIGGVGAAFKVGNYSSGGESIGFNSSVLTANLSNDAEYSQTIYGVQYVTLRNLYVIPIINSGARRC